MYCEARTTTGLGCDSLGLVQCERCDRQLAYLHGYDKPNYPVPAIRLEVWHDLIQLPCTAIPALIVRDNGDGSYTEIWPNDFRR